MRFYDRILGCHNWCNMPSSSIIQDGVLGRERWFCAGSAPPTNTPTGHAATRNRSIDLLVQVLKQLLLLLELDVDDPWRHNRNKNAGRLASIASDRSFWSRVSSSTRRCTRRCTSREIDVLNPKYIVAIPKSILMFFLSFFQLDASIGRTGVLMFMKTVYPLDSFTKAQTSRTARFKGKRQSCGAVQAIRSQPSTTLLKG